MKDKTKLYLEGIVMGVFLTISFEVMVIGMIGLMS